jgi:hypothetical protein
MRRTENLAWSHRTWIALSLIYVCIFAFTHRKFQDHIVSDACTYYIFLPAAFIYDDLTFGYVEHLPEELKKVSFVSYPTESGTRLPKVTFGVAVMQLPFFLIAQLEAKMFDYPLNGYSAPYQLMIAVAALVYFIAGIYFVRKILLHFFSDGITSAALVLITLATTLMHYTLFEPGMSHVYSFFACSIFVWAAIQWHTSFSSRHFLVMCFSLGVITLIRPFNVLLAIFPLLYGMNHREIFVSKICFIKTKFPTIIAGLVVFMLPVSLQLLLWKYQAGSFIIDSYQGERFFLDRPHLADILFGFRNGWLIYTPVMIVSFIGLPVAFKKKFPFAWPLAVFFPVVLYFLSCWSCYTFAGAFGYRPLIDYYPLLILPAAAFIEAVSRQHALRILSLSFLVLLSALNIFQHYQFRKGLIHYSDMTAKAYAAVFGRTEFPENFSAMLDPFDLENARAGKPLRNLRDFEDCGYPILEQRPITLKTSNGKFLSADPEADLLLTAKRETHGVSENFTLILFSQNRCALKSWNGRYMLCANRGEIRAVMDLVDETEVYGYEFRESNKIALKAWTGKFLSLDSVDQQVKAISDTVSTREIFIVVAQ